MPSVILPRHFYARDVDVVARDLLGCRLLHAGTGGRIVEVEAYAGPGDPGSHAHRAPNGRARIMFGTPGVAYVYFTYGMHHCVNAVAHAEGGAGAVLIRAVELDEPRAGAGPGKLCRALGIARDQNGADLTRGPLVIRPGRPPAEVLCGPRIGLSADDGREWRFWTPSVSVSRR